MSNVVGDNVFVKSDNHAINLSRASGYINDCEMIEPHKRNPLNDIYNYRDVFFQVLCTSETILCLF